MAAVVTFGEAMLRFSPPGRRRLEQADALEVWPAGAELNVAVGLARLGTPSAWVSRLPGNPLGRLIEKHARAHGVQTEEVRWDDSGRLGLYFVEVAGAPRASTALYDRAGSSFATLEPREFDWPSLLAEARAFHTSGITAALSESCRRATEDALAAARSAGCLTSFDLNFRSRLTSADHAREFAERAAPSVDVLLISEHDARIVFGSEGGPQEVAAELQEALAIEHVVVSTRIAEGDGSYRRLSAYAGEEAQLVRSPAFEPRDPVGGGDAFAAGYLHGMLEAGPLRGLEVGAATAALKQSIPGDFPLVTPEEVERLLAEPESVRMNR